MEHPSLSYNFVFGSGPSNSYFFETRHGIVYEVKFKPSGYIFENIPAFRKNTYEFIIEIAENTSESLKQTDALIPPTIARIFFDFFRNKETLIVYICDSSDSRQAVRYRKFNAWYEHYQTDNFLKIDIRLSDVNGFVFTSLVLRRDHPDLPGVVTAFNEVTRSDEENK